MMKLTKKQFAEYHRTDLGMVFQAYNLITSLTVLDNVALPQMFLSISKRKREKWGMQLLERFGIDKQYKKIPTELSGGQQQRIGIARAIVNNPKIVLADEPVGNLDSVSAKNVLEILSQLNEVEKKTIIMVTHNPENLIYADRIFYLKDGTIIREVVNKDKHKEILKQDQKTLTAEITDLMRAYHGLTPEQINILIMPYKSRIFAHHFITTRTMEETKVFEDIIQRRLMGTVTSQEMQDTLHRSAVNGGVGFDIRVTEHIMDRINLALKMSYFIYQTHHQKKNADGSHDPVTDDEKTEALNTYLLHTCYADHAKNLEPEQIVRLKKAIRDRLTNVIQKADFYTALDQPFKEGGVGLNSKTAQTITEEIELVLILGFGIVKINSQDIEGMDEENEQEKRNKEEISQQQPATSVANNETDADSDELKINSDNLNKEDNVADQSRSIGGNSESSIDQGPASEVKVNLLDDDDIAKSERPDEIDDSTSLQDAIFVAQEREKRMKETVGNIADNKKENDIYF